MHLSLAPVVFLSNSNCWFSLYRCHPTAKCHQCIYTHGYIVLLFSSMCPGQRHLYTENRLILGWMVYTTSSGPTCIQGLSSRSQAMCSGPISCQSYIMVEGEGMGSCETVFDKVLFLYSLWLLFAWLVHTFTHHHTTILSQLQQVKTPPPAKRRRVELKKAVVLVTPVVKSYL